MSKSLLQTRIVDKLEVIMTQVDTMNKFGKHIPLIHLDILKSNIRTFYEQICELERTQMQSTSLFKETKAPAVSKETEERIVAEATETISKIAESIQEEIVTEYSSEVKINVEPVVEAPVAPVEIQVASVETSVIPVEISTPTAEIELKEEVVELKENAAVEIPVTTHTSLLDEAPLLQIETAFEKLIVDEKPEEELLVQSPIPDIFSSLQTIADRYKTPDSSLNEAMAISNVSTVNTAVKQVRDLKSSIGINEKFLFINELFKGNLNEYTDTIVQLSDAQTLDVAHQILTPLKNKYEWREDSAAYITLIDFLQRRFV